MDITIINNNLKKKESVSAESTNGNFAIYDDQGYLGYEFMPYLVSASFTPKVEESIIKF